MLLMTNYQTKVQAMTKIIKDEEFYETYKPIKNPIDNNASFDGAMLETYGAELEHVLKVAREKPDHVWTVIDGDGGLCISTGYHFVNRLGYIITEVPFTEDVCVYDEEDADDDTEGDSDDDSDDEPEPSAPRG